MTDDETTQGADAAATGDRMQIGVVAERLGLSVRTLHYWEEVGLVPPSARSAGGFRLYTEDDVARLTIIRRMKPLGFTLEEMRALLDAFLTLHTPEATADMATNAEDTINACRQRVATRRSELQRLIAWADEFDDLLVRKAL